MRPYGRKLKESKAESHSTRAADLVLIWRQRTGTEGTREDAVLRDLMCDLRHWAGNDDSAWAEAVQSAEEDWEATQEEMA